MNRFRFLLRHLLKGIKDAMMSCRKDIDGFDDHHLEDFCWILVVIETFFEVAMNFCGKWVSVLVIFGSI